MKNNVLADYNKLKVNIEGLDIALYSMVHESDSSYLSRISIYFTTKLDSIKKAIGLSKDNVKSNIKNDKPSAIVQELLKYKNNAKELGKTVTFNQVSEYDVVTVVGLKTNLYEVTKELVQIFNVINVESKTIIGDLDLLISRVLSDKEFRTSTKPIKADDLSKKAVVVLQDKLEDLINPKDINEVTKIKNLLPNISCIYGIYEDLVDISAGFTTKELEDLVNTSDSVYEKVNVLIDEMKNKQYEISKAIISKISADLENGAKLITLISSYHYLYNQVVTVFKLLIDKLSK